MHTWWSLLTHAPNSLYSLFLSLSLSLCHALTVGCGFHSADLFLYCSFNEKQLSFFSPNLFPSLRSCKGRARPLRSRNSFSPFSPAFFPWTMQFLCRQLGRESETRVRERESEKDHSTSVGGGGYGICSALVFPVRGAGWAYHRLGLAGVWLKLRWCNENPSVGGSFNPDFCGQRRFWHLLKQSLTF